jgi:hypothetical protein
MIKNLISTLNEPQLKLNSNCDCIWCPTKNQRTPRLLARLISFILSLPLRERIKVRGAVKIFSSSFFTLHLRERARVRGK